MRVFVIPTKRGTAHPMDISYTVESMQFLVGGYYDFAGIPQLRDNGIELVVNADGVLTGLPPNENLWPFFYVGQVFMVGNNGEDLVSLTAKQIAFIKAWLAGLT